VLEAKLRQHAFEVGNVNLVCALGAGRDAEDPICWRQSRRNLHDETRVTDWVGHVNQWPVRTRPVPHRNADVVQLDDAFETDVGQRGGPAMALTRCCGSIQRRVTSVTCSRVSERTMSG